MTLKIVRKNFVFFNEIMRIAAGFDINGNYRARRILTVPYAAETAPAYRHRVVMRQAARCDKCPIIVKKHEVFLG